MSAKKLSIIFLIILIFIGIYYYKLADQLNVAEGQIGAGYFPKILAVTLIVLSGISIVQRFIEKKDRHVTTNNLTLIFITIGITALYFILWSRFGYFYLLSFIFLLSLFLILRKKVMFNKELIKIILITIVSLLIIFLVFDKLLMIPF